MILTATDVHWIDMTGHPWTECSLMAKSFFHKYVANVTTRSERFEASYKPKMFINNVKVSKNGGVVIYANDRNGESKCLRASEQHVFLQHSIPGTYEFDIFDGRQNKGRWNEMELAISKDLNGALFGWRLQRLVLDAYGDGKHALFIVFQDESDFLLFSSVFEQRLQKAGLKLGRK